ncbi:MAG: DUF6036 family nucleotidyltransferase [Planctomycetaceae bacterium]|nr:hypothetical protein [Phycisphaerales bacterium]MCE2654103.1 DUF6036 family nucleotidyltransferase [Planctomycetaceae bacterium]
MDGSALMDALAKVGERLAERDDGEVEIVLVGAAAGMLTGELPASRTTSDCDVMVLLPEEALGRLAIASEAVAADLGLPPTWLNTDVQLRRDALPEDWATRCHVVGQWGSLRVKAIGRWDLIAMKTLAGRAQDLADLRRLRPTAAEWRAVHAYLDALPARGTSQQEVAAARELAKRLEDLDHA